MVGRAFMSKTSTANVAITLLVCDATLITINLPLIYH